MRTYALMRHLFILLTVISAEFLENPLGSFFSNEISVVRGNFLDEMKMPPNVVGDRLTSGKNDYMILAPVLNSDDAVHMLNVAQRFCKESGGGGGHGAESHLCDLKLLIKPSPPMYYKYPTDGDPGTPGNDTAGWDEFEEFNKRRSTFYHRGFDWLIGSPLDQFEANAEKMFSKYPRAEGLKCDAVSQRMLEIGEDPRIIPYGKMAWGWPETLDSARYEGVDVAGGLVANLPATEGMLKDYGLDKLTVIEEKQVELLEELSGKPQRKHSATTESLLQDSANDWSTTLRTRAKHAKAKRKHHDGIVRRSAMEVHNREDSETATSNGPSDDTDDSNTDPTVPEYRDIRLETKPVPDKDFVAEKTASDAPINRDIEPWCFVPTRHSVEKRFSWLKKKHMPFGGEDPARYNAPRLTYSLRDTCRNHHYGLIFACAPEKVQVSMFFKMSRIDSELRAREDHTFHKACLRIKQLAKGTPQEPECPKEQYLFYEDDDGDVHFREHAFGTLKVDITFSSTGLVSGRPSTYNTKVEMGAMLYRTGNVGWWDLIALVVYFVTFSISFKGELGTLFFFPHSVFKISRMRKKFLRYQDGGDLIMNLIDPMELNRDVFPTSNAFMALASCLARVLFHLASMYYFFNGNAIYSREFGRTTPYEYCDLMEGGLEEISKDNPRAAERMSLNPNWSAFYDGMQMTKSGDLITAPYTTFNHDLDCVNPLGYTKSKIYSAAIIDLFFLPYDHFMVTLLKDLANFFSLLFLFFITEEYVSWNWVAVTAKRGLIQLQSFFPVFVGILVGATFILKERFGLYFMQFKTFTRGFLNLASWALSTPANHLTDDFDFMNDNQSWVLAIYFIAVSCAVVILAANIFISIIMEAYSSAREERGQNYKWIKASYYLVHRKRRLYKKQSWFRKVFPNVKVAFDRTALIQHLRDKTITTPDGMGI